MLPFIQVKETVSKYTLYLHLPDKNYIKVQPSSRLIKHLNLNGFPDMGIQFIRKKLILPFNELSLF